MISSKSTDKLLMIQEIISKVSTERKVKKLKIKWTVVKVEKNENCPVPELEIELE